MQAISVVLLAALLACVAGVPDNCPHPNEARTLLLQKLVIAAAPNDGRWVESVEIPKEVIGRSDLSCIAAVANRAGATPDYLSFGRNRLGGYSIILHSRIRNAMNATIYVYAQ